MTVQPFTFLIFALAVWRISSLLVNEDGPFDIFIKLRWKAGVRFDKESEPYGTNVISKGLLCVWCVSVWIAGVGAILISANFLEYIVLVLALSAAAIMVECLVNRK